VKIQGVTKLESLFFRIRHDYYDHIEFAGKILLHGDKRLHGKLELELETIGQEEFYITSLETYNEIKEALNK